MKESHTPEPWELSKSTEDYQGCFITGNGRTIAATITKDACKVTEEDVANASLMVTAPALLKALRQIACEADFDQADGAMELGQRLMDIEREAKTGIESYEGRLAPQWRTPMNKPDFYEMAAWLHEYDLASKLEGWLVTNDSDNNCCIARLDDPLNMYHQPGWPQDFTEPKFASDEEAIQFVRQRAEAGSQWHAQAIAIHEARIPLSLWIPGPTLHEQILERCSVGPWKHGLHLPGFSADSQPCVYGDERELPLAMLDEDDEEASANVVLMAAAWELCEQLCTLVNAALAVERKQVSGTEPTKLRERCNCARILLSRIRSEVHQSATERYGEEEPDE